MDKQIGVGIIGGSGYGAGELLRLLATHPQTEVVSVVSRSHIGRPISDLHPQLLGFYDLICEEKINFKNLSLYDQKVIFSALPHGVSAKTISALLETDSSDSLRIIDLSGDFRLKNLHDHAIYYPESPACNEIRDQFCYGLPELSPLSQTTGRKEISKSRLIANPGCYATSCILAVAPLIGKKSASVFFDSKSGTSGAGRSLTSTTHHPEMHGNMTAYKALQHRHEPEIQQFIGQDLPCSFVPHLLPVARGIYTTAHLEFATDVRQEELYALYQEFYKNARFVRLRPTPPRLEDVVTSNFCDISVTSRGRRAVIMTALDNLVKGMAGQALQNMNLMCDLPEETGLLFPAPSLI